MQIFFYKIRIIPYDFNYEFTYGKLIFVVESRRTIVGVPKINVILISEFFEPTFSGNNLCEHTTVSAASVSAKFWYGPGTTSKATMRSTKKLSSEE